MLRVLQKSILTTLFTVFASQASAMFIQADWFDPTQPGVGTNRYAYSHNDPINLMDPSGNATISVGDDYVQVDADGDGDVDDDDLSQEHIDIFARDYKEFIIENSGAILSKHGAKRVGGTQAETTYLRAASQFIGYNIEGGFPEDTIVMPGYQMNPGLSSSTAGRLDMHTNLETGVVTYVMGINLGALDQRTNASELARTMIHEYLHRDDQMGAVFPVIDAHRAIDNHAKGLLSNYGLSGGGCSGVGGFLGFGGFSGC